MQRKTTKTLRNGRMARNVSYVLTSEKTYSEHRDSVEKLDAVTIVSTESEGKALTVNVKSNQYLTKTLQESYNASFSDFEDELYALIGLKRCDGTNNYNVETSGVDETETKSLYEEFYALCGDVLETQSIMSAYCVATSGCSVYCVLSEQFASKCAIINRRLHELGLSNLRIVGPQIFS
jgi:nitrogen fixation/metabolism regulation signal transduction histidine kinase